MNKDKTLESVRGIREAIKNINDLFLQVDKEIAGLDKKIQVSKSVDNKGNAVSIYNSNKDNFKNFLNKIGVKADSIEKSFNSEKDDKVKKETSKDKNKSLENKKEVK